MLEAVLPSKPMHRLLTGPLTLERVTIPIRDLPLPLNGQRIVQLSDFHFDGVRLSPQLLQAAIAETNALAADLVVLTGDYITQETTPIFELAEQLQRLESRCGTLAILGNHDNPHHQGRSTIIKALSRAGIDVLWNEIAYPFGAAFPVVGLADVRSREFLPQPLFETLSPAVARLVLSHNPDSAALLRTWRVDLQLSGHTHGGQVVLPWLGPLPALTQARIPLLRKATKLMPKYRRRCATVVRHWEWSAGLYRVGEGWLYVNRGLGTYRPGRLFCPPELTEITLVCQPEPLG